MALNPFLPERAKVLEIASGTRQHAVYIASQRPDIVWQPSDRDDESVRSIEEWRFGISSKTSSDSIIERRSSIVFRLAFSRLKAKLPLLRIKFKTLKGSAMKFMPRILVSSCLAATFTLGCADQKTMSQALGYVEEPVAVLVSSMLIAQIDQANLTQKLASYGIVPRNGVKIYRLSYNTLAPDQSAVKASGVIILPDTQSPVFPWISLQHGTILAKSEAPSLAPGEGLAEASQGFLTVVPDYLGYGDSADLLHPYIIEAGYVAPLLDMLRATREFASTTKLNLGPLFLKGYSEGGYATLALQKAIETDSEGEFTIAASSASAGPYDVDYTGTLTAQKPKINPGNIPFLMLSYNHWLANDTLPLSEIFVPSEATVSDALNGSHSLQEIFKILPSDTNALFKADFITDFVGAHPTLDVSKKIHKLLKSQSLVAGPWVPSSPTRFYHCVDDEQIPVAVTEKTATTFKNLGAPVEAILIPSMDISHPFTHTTCPAIFSPIKWFAQILSGSAA